jgi:hypothetical protein
MRLQKTVHDLQELNRKKLYAELRQLKCDLDLVDMIRSKETKIDEIATDLEARQELNDRNLSEIYSELAKPSGFSLSGIFANKEARKTKLQLTSKILRLNTKIYKELIARLGAEEAKNQSNSISEQQKQEDQNIIRRMRERRNRS